MLFPGGVTSWDSMQLLPMSRVRLAASLVLKIIAHDIPRNRLDFRLHFHAGPPKMLKYYNPKTSATANLSTHLPNFDKIVIWKKTLTKLIDFQIE